MGDPKSAISRVRVGDAAAPSRALRDGPIEDVHHELGAESNR